TATGGWVRLTGPALYPAMTVGVGAAELAMLATAGPPAATAATAAATAPGTITDLAFLVSNLIMTHLPVTLSTAAPAPLSSRDRVSPAERDGPRHIGGGPGWAAAPRRPAVERPCVTNDSRPRRCVTNHPPQRRRRAAAWRRRLGPRRAA